MASQGKVLSLPAARQPGALAIEYLAECERNSVKPNALLFKRLDLASVEYEKGEAIELVCIGSEKETFLERLKDSDLSVLLQSLQNKRAKLRSLDLSFHCLSGETGKLFSLFGCLIESLICLRLKSNLFNGSGAEALCNSLLRCSSLSLLDLSNNKLGRDGGRALSVLIGKLENLKALDVSDCEIDLEGLVHLTTAIQDENRVGPRASLTPSNLRSILQEDQSSKPYRCLCYWLTAEPRDCEPRQSRRLLQQPALLSYWGVGDAHCWRIHGIEL